MISRTGPVKHDVKLEPAAPGCCLKTFLANWTLLIFHKYSNKDLRLSIIHKNTKYLTFGPDRILTLFILKTRIISKRIIFYYFALCNIFSFLFFSIICGKILIFLEKNRLRGPIIIVVLYRSHTLWPKPNRSIIIFFSRENRIELNRYEFWLGRGQNYFYPTKSIKSSVFIRSELAESNHGPERAKSWFFHGKIDLIR